MTTCQMANRVCSNEGTNLVRIPPAGDRRICDEDLAVLDRMGVGYRRLQEEPTQIPAWRQRDLSRDETGRMAS